MLINRSLSSLLGKALSKNKSVLLLGPRQTGKTTLISQIEADIILDFSDPRLRQRYEKNPGLIIDEVLFLPKKAKKRPKVILDEVQKVPAILDSAQYLIDRQLAQFIITGSSARKLRRGVDVNLLPGRVITFRMTPLLLSEYPGMSLKNILNYGTLPKITQIGGHQEKEQELDSYVTTYLEEEIRAEALVRNIGHFSRFLEMAALESGRVVNFSRLSQDVGVSHVTIASFYEILKDCLIAEKIDPITTSATRKKLTKASKYVFFDMGVRRFAAKENIATSPDQLGKLFEQWVGLELLYQKQYLDPQMRLFFWRDPDGPEVDWVLKKGAELIPIEVKWTDAPRKNDARHIETFLQEYPQAKRGFVVCQTPRSFSLGDRITAIPWTKMSTLM